jgi:hypothetical protein
MAWLNNYSLRVAEGNETAGGYVELEHGQQYRLVLRNSRMTACDARVEIDSKDVGTFRIYAYSSVTLERPAGDKSKFTFYKVGTSEAKQAQLNESDPNLGLVKVTFTPELYVKPLSPVYVSQQKTPWTYTPTYTYMADSNATYRANFGSQNDNVAMAAMASLGDSSERRAGGTGLSGHSNQDFTTVAPLNYDLTQQTVIFLRLVLKTGIVKPLTSYSTQVPPRID